MVLRDLLDSVMELGRVSSDGDPYAGYVVDDSDLEYSDCSEER